jgi:isoleucyl-tRNA synthetase
MEHLYQDLNKVSCSEAATSVHLTLFPEVDESAIDLDLEQKMSLAQTISSLTHSIRKKEKIKVRQPLTKIMIPVLDEKIKHQIEEVTELIKSEINVREIEFLHDTSGVMVKKIKPNFRVIGQKFGPKVKFVAGAVNQWGQEEITALEADGEFEIMIEGEPVKLTLEDVEISSEDIPGWSVASEGKVTVALDINITDELRREGFARDFVNRIQNLRKDQGLDVQDKIEVLVSSDEELVVSSLNANADYICAETQAEKLEIVANADNGHQVEIDGHLLELHLNVI